MMSINKSIAKLLSIASAPLNASTPSAIEAFGTLNESLREELMSILRIRNGFHAFESALRFFPDRSSLISVGIEEWNCSTGWRAEYGNLANGCLFFAEDIFGGQFCVADGKIWSFDPETGDRTFIGTSFSDWAQSILDDFEMLTGFPLAHAWQESNGPIPEGMRLVPSVPFILNGAFELANLQLMDAEKGMRLRAGLARQLVNIPDGSKVKINFTKD